MSAPVSSDELRQSVRAVLQRWGGPASTRRQSVAPPADTDLLRALADLGLFGLAVPEARGGSGGTMADLGAAVEEIGAALVATPVLGSVLAARALLTAHSDEAAVHLRAVASGSIRAAILLPSSGPAADGVVAEPNADGWVLRGRLPAVLDGADAELLLVPVSRAEGIALFVVQAADTSSTSLPVVDLTRRLARFELDGVPARLVAAPGDWDPDRYRDEVLALLSADAVGGTAAVLDLTVDYAKTRHQFGRPIGSFQAVKHRCAEMAISTQTARVALGEALRQLEEDGSDAALYCAIAKVSCGEAYVSVTAQAIQTLGGIGFTWEHDAHLYFKRAHADNVLAGGRTSHWPRITSMIDA
jgi:alkylation response protein AidB-like acyl-CoA dehydrogenase